MLALLEMLGISREEAAFGDADNDLDMLQAVKYSVAMGNASQHLKEAAWKVTGTNEEDGVAQMIRTLMEN